MDDQAQHEKRGVIFDFLQDGASWLAERAYQGDRRVFDLESSRVKALGRLNADLNPRLPSVIDSFGRTRRVSSISDLEEMGGALLDQIDELLDYPENFGVELVSELDVETLLLLEDA